MVRSARLALVMHRFWMMQVLQFGMCLGHDSREMIFHNGSGGMGFFLYPVK